MIKKIFILPLAILLTLIMIKPYFNSGFPYTHDGENHLARFANYKLALKEGQFPPRFAPNLMNHYGYPVFNYNYPLANILSLPFSALGLNYELIFKLIAGGLIFLGLIGFYHWLDELKLTYGGMVFGTGLYALSPFMWSTILYRGNMGTIAAYGLFPWMLWLIEKSRHRLPRLRDFLIGSAFLLSHNVAVLFGLPILLAYAGFRFRLNRRWWSNLGSTLSISVLLTLWFWLPAVAEKKLVTVGSVDLVSNFAQHFPTLKQLILSPLGFGFTFLGQIDSLSFGLGLTQVIVLGLTLIMIAKRSLNKTQLTMSRLQIMLVFFIAGLIIFQLKITQPVWQLMPLAAFIQFPWRLSLFLAPFLAAWAAVAWPWFKLRLKIALGIILLLQLISLYQLTPADYFHKLNRDYDAFSQSTTTQNENLPVSFKYQHISDWQPAPAIIHGQAEVQVETWRGSYRSYRLQVTQTATVVEPTMSFRGWKTWIKLDDLRRQEIDYLDNDQILGRIGYQLPPGEYTVISKFTQRTWPRVVGNSVSLAVGLIILVVVGRRLFKPQLNFFVHWKLALFSISLLASQFIVYQPSFPYAESILATSGWPQWLYSWANFDGVHYLTIIQHGYVGTGLIQAFFPLFPLTVKMISSIWFQPLMVGLILNFLFGYLFLINWRKLVSFEMGADVQQLGMSLLFLFPTALFLNAFYSEALFLWLATSSLLSARAGNWLKAGIMAALASATRVVGIALVPAFLVELWLQHGVEISHFMRFLRQQKTKIMVILLGSAGLVTYMFYLKTHFNDWLYFLHVQAEFGAGRQESLILYPQVVWRYLKILWTYRPLDLKYLIYVQELMVGVLGLAGLIWSWFKVRQSIVLFSLLVFLIPTTTGTFSSLPRYFLASLSVFLLMTKLLKNRLLARYLWLGTSTCLLIFNTILFIQGYWVA